MPDNITILPIDDDTEGGGGGGGWGFLPAPTGLSSIATFSDRVTLLWDEIDGGIEYRITYGLNTISRIYGTSFTIVGLSPNTPYTFTVAVKHSSNIWSNPSNPITIYTTALTPPDPDNPPDTSGNEGEDPIGSFIFMTEYTVPSGNTGECIVKYRVGNFSSGLTSPVITKTVDKSVLITGFNLDPSFSGTRVFNPLSYGLE